MNKLAKTQNFALTELPLSGSFLSLNAKNGKSDNQGRTSFTKIVEREKGITTRIALSASKSGAQEFHLLSFELMFTINDLSCSEEFRRLNFQPSEYTSERGKTYPMYEMTKNGFFFLVVGYNGRKDGEIKEKYIAAFDSLVEMVVKQDAILKMMMP